MRVEILGSGHRDIVNGSRFYDEQQRGLGNYFRASARRFYDIITLNGV